MPWSPPPPLLTHIPDPSKRMHSVLFSAKGVPFGSSTSDGILPKRMCSPLTTLDLIHFCLNCMTPRRITLKDSAYSLHSFLKGTYQALGNMTESIPPHSPLCLPPPSPTPRDSLRPFPFLSAGTRSFRWRWTRAPSTIRSLLDVSAAWGKAGV